jgi:purine-binding chemotaxis protein CheW
LIEETKADELVAYMQVAIFRVGQERFALDIRHIREITRLEQISSVPSMPSFVEGVMELRGQIIPVVDLRKRLEAGIENSRQTRIIVSRLEKKPLGLIVDEVTDVWEIEDGEIGAAPSVGSNFKPSFLDGVLKRNDLIVFVLDFTELLSTAERAEVASLREQEKAAKTKSNAKKTVVKKTAPRKTATKKAGK